MNQVTDIMTFLCCVDEGTIATKKIVRQKDDSIEKVQFSSGKRFTREEVEVSSIRTLGQTIQAREDSPEKVLIRGIAQEGASKITCRRKVGSEDGVFYDPGKLWVMFDIDDFQLPGWMDPAQDPEGVVKWVRAALPKPFRKVTCFYQFSSGQNVPKKIGEEPPKIAKLHLFFWLDRRVTSQQWRDYLNG